MTKRFGFTLAEVLITLGIIGVVAAMTIPTLISNTNGAQFKTAYKKALSTLNQAVLMNIAMDDTDFSTLKADAATAGQPITPGSMGDLLVNRLQSATDITDSYFEAAGTPGAAAGAPTTLTAMEYKTTVTCTAEGEPAEDCEAADVGNEIEVTVNVAAPADNTWRVYSFADGTSFAYLKAAANCSEINENCVGFIDVNGSAGPNKAIDCSSGTAEDGQDEEITECDASKITDIFPVFFHGQTVEPANDSARAVLFGK